MMLELYHAEPVANSMKTLLCLKEKDLKFHSHYVDLLRFEQHRPEFLKLNPNGQVPVLVHNGAVITESTVINEYLDIARGFFTGPEPGLANAVLGVAFKGRPATDDLRGSTVFELLHALRRYFPDATVAGFDPLVHGSAIAELGMEPAVSIESAFAGASAVFLHNNHPDLEGLPIARLGQSMARPGIVYDFWGQNRAVTGLPPGIHVAGLGSWPPTLRAAARMVVQSNVA